MTASVEILIVGAGWTAEFLIPLLKEEKVPFAASTRNGRVVADYRTIKFTADAESDWSTVPKARTIILTFPTTEKGAVTGYVKAYESVHGSGCRWLQLGSTSAWNDAAELHHKTSFLNHKTPIPRPAAPRVESEFELLELSSSKCPTSVLNLSGLWGAARSPRNWVVRIAGTKEDIAAKGGVHLVHGVDVAQAILAIHKDFEPGERWLLTDTRIYDWWDLASAWGTGSNDSNEHGNQAQWVLELMEEHKVATLPRANIDLPGKHLSSNEFWLRFKIVPLRARLEEWPGDPVSAKI